MNLPDKQQRVYVWLKDELDSPNVAEAYKGAVRLLEQKSEGYITFVSHAGRDMMNYLARYCIDANAKQTQYVELVNNLKPIWKDEWRGRGINISDDEALGHLIPYDVCEKITNLIEEHNKGRNRSLEATNSFFGTFLDYSDRENMPDNFLSDWKAAKKWFMKLTHLKKIEFSKNDASELNRHFSTLDSFLYVAASSQYERIKKLKEILKTPTDEMIKEALHLVKTETDRRYFFSTLKDPLWIHPLAARGFYESPPKTKNSDGYVQFPFWPEFDYLINICKEAPDDTIEIILGLPKTNNPRIYYGIVEIALKLNIEYSIKLLPKLLEYTEIKNHFSTFDFPELLAYWAEKGQAIAALELAQKLILFHPDLKAKEKEKQRRKVGSDNLFSTLEPAPNFDEWEYQQILENGVQLLAEKEPYKVAVTLIGATENMIRMYMYQDYFDKGSDKDFSEMWCQNLDKSDRGYQCSKETLVYALTFACRKVYEQSEESIEILDQMLRKQRWEIFKRLRQYLYALNPSEQTLPWIQEFILGYEDYAKWSYNYEFQLMIRKACEHFGSRLLSEENRMRIFDTILNGPSKEDFRERWKDEFTEEKFQQRKYYFHRKQLQPFAQVLTGKYQHRYQKLNLDLEEESFSDKDYYPVRATSGTISYRSPRSSEDLAKFKDDELLAYINKWSKEHWEDGDILVEINIRALADAFQSVFKDSIIPDDERFEFWMDKRDQIKRPVYVKAIIQAIQAHVIEQKFEHLEKWLEFCDWVLSHPDTEDGESVQQSDESQEHPNWRSSRHAVCDFLGKCLEEKVNVPLNVREKLANLLKSLCTQTEATNNTRRRALEILVNFGFWVHRYVPDDDVSEITSILEERFKSDSKYPLTLPEYALLGSKYSLLFSLNQDWAAKHKEDFFPQGDFSTWKEAFGNFLLFSHPFKPIFKTLEDDFTFALNYLPELKEIEDSGPKFINRLGQHLFAYYLWEDDSHEIQDGLLGKFYDRTSKKYWASLFDYIGRSLRNSGEHVEVNLITRITALFDWRFEVQESKELSRFTFWLAAKCLSPDWRLDSYSKILDISQIEGRSISMELSVLNKLLPNHTAKVVECFSKITRTIDKVSSSYIQINKAKPIIDTGLSSSDEEVRKNAEEAQEKLLRCERFDFLTDS